MAWPTTLRRRRRSLLRPISREISSETEWKKGREYAIVVDAGSSGSRAQIYSWKNLKLQAAERAKLGLSTNVLPVVEKGTWEGSSQEWQLKVEPGLSSFASDPSGIRSYLAPLFTHAIHVIPHDKWSTTPVYILATAGMRLLSESEQHAILSETCKYLRGFVLFNSGTDADCKENVRIISGEEEGLLGWISINYLMDGFHFRQKTPQLIEGGTAQPQTAGRSTYGFLDMGGASTQIAFEPSPSAKQQSHGDLTPVKLRMLDGSDAVHDVFVTTFLGFGTNKARERYLDGLFENATAAHASPTPPHTDSAPNAELPSAEIAVPDPCLPTGRSKILSPPSGIAQSSQKITLNGTGSFSACLNATLPLLDKHAVCTRPPCLFHGVHVPPIDFSVNHFIGVSEYWYSSNDIFKLGGVYDFVSFQKKAAEFCSTSWGHLSTGSYGPTIDASRLEQQCFKAAWMTTVLHEGIGLPRLVDKGGKGDGKPHADQAADLANDKNLFQSVNDLNGLAVSWTLGKAVEQASRSVQPAINPAANDAAVGVLPGKADNELAAHPPEQPWHRPADDQISAPPRDRLSRTSTPLVIILVVVVALIVWVTRRARRRRRAVLGRPLGGPPTGPSQLDKSLQRILAFFGTSSRPHGGDYMLANMEEGHDDFEDASTRDGYNGRKYDGAAMNDSDLEDDGEGDPRLDDARTTDEVRRKKVRRRGADSALSRFLPAQIRNVSYTLLSSLGIKHGGVSYSTASSTLPVQYSRAFPPRIPSRHGTPAVSPSPVIGPSGTRSPPRLHALIVKNGVTSFRPSSPSFPSSPIEGAGALPSNTVAPPNHNLGVSTSSTAAARSLSRPTSRNALRAATSSPALASSANIATPPHGLAAASATSSAFSSRTASPAFGLPPSHLMHAMPIAVGSPGAYARKGSNGR